jgi:hypothetical protein
MGGLFLAAGTQLGVDERQAPIQSVCVTHGLCTVAGGYPNQRFSVAQLSGVGLTIKPFFLWAKRIPPWRPGVFLFPTIE